MNKPTFYPELYSDFKYGCEQTVFLPYIYFDGELESLVGASSPESGADLVCSHSRLNTIKSGIWPCNVFDTGEENSNQLKVISKDATLFIWRSNTEDDWRVRTHGLIVLNSDKKAYARAKKKFEENASMV